MNQPEPLLQKPHVDNALNWFRTYFHNGLVKPMAEQFSNWPAPREIQAVLDRTEAISRVVEGWSGDLIPWGDLFERLSGDANLLPLFQRIILLYRRVQAVRTEIHTEKTFHLELLATLESEVKALDALTATERFAAIDPLRRLPRLKDFLPVQYIEAAALNQLALQPRQYDEKFHILQAPQLFLPDVGYFRAKCEDRETPLAIAFVDIDDFKSLNSRHHETKVDRNVLPRFMQAIEAHVFHHGYAYRQGGDEYLILVPSLSRLLAIAFLDELRCKLADLTYPDVAEKTTVSIGLCIADSDCPLTDRELLDRANRAKQFAKQSGKNRIATYRGSRFIDQELEVVKSSVS